MNNFLSKLRVASSNIDLNVKNLFRGLVGTDTIAGLGTTQADGAPLTATVNVLTIADGTVGWVLPPALKDMKVKVVNTVATANAKVYAAVGEVINALGTTAAFSVVAGSESEFICDADAHWYVRSAAASGAGVGYQTGAGGAVAQLTNRTTGVTLSKLTGTITTHTASLGAETAAAFTVTNTLVAIGDVIAVSIQSGSNGGNTKVFISTVGAGSFAITVANDNAAAGTAETGAILINYAVIKAVSA